MSTQFAGLRESFSVYARLGNFKVYIQWLPVLIGWALIADPLGLSLGESVAVVLLMAAALCGAACGGALDHVQGFRDGIDQQTYGAEGVQGGYQTKSDASIKPLVTGEITDPAARRFGIGIGMLSVLLGTAAFLLSPQAPLWLVPVVGPVGADLEPVRLRDQDLLLGPGRAPARRPDRRARGPARDHARRRPEHRGRVHLLPDRDALLPGHAVLDDLRPRRRRLRGSPHARRPFRRRPLPRPARRLDLRRLGGRRRRLRAPASSSRGCWRPGCPCGRCRSASCATASSAPTR